jgi:hypothetical protein
MVRVGCHALQAVHQHLLQAGQGLAQALAPQSHPCLQGSDPAGGW